MKVRVLCSMMVVLFLIGCSNVAMGVFSRIADKNIGLSSMTDLDDGLYVALCGAGGPLPDPKRSGPCVAIIAGQQLVIVDAGSGGARVLARMQLPHGQISRLFLTHFHSDHIDGLGEMAMMRWVNAANTEPLTVVGPTGVTRVVSGFNEVYAQDAIYRNAHHGNTVAPLSGKGMQAQSFELPEPGEKIVVYEEDGLVVSAFKVDHEPVSVAVGYRFDYKGRSVVVSGDTAKSENLQKMAQGADVLVHEALSRELVGVINSAAQKNNNAIIAKITADIIDYHASPVEAAEVAEAAQVGHLLFYHVVPPLLLPGMEGVFLKGVSYAYSGDVSVGVDGFFLGLPANSDEINVLGDSLFP